MKIIYTAISKGYDNLKDPTTITPGWEYICFTDDETLTSKVWTVIYRDFKNTKDVRKIKINIPFTNFKTSIWIDGSIRINCDLDQFIGKYHKGDFTLMKHNVRDCIYQEAEACIKRKKDNEKIINKQIQKYRDSSYPEHRGLVATGVMIRNNTEEVKEFCEEWFNEVERFSKRDQLSFNYIAYHHWINYSTMPFDILYDEMILNKHI